MMSFLKNIFGGSAPKQPDATPSQGLERLEEHADMIRKKIAHTQSQIEEQEKIARANATTNKSRALAALRKKKALEGNLKNYEATLDNIESQKDMLENASSNAAVLKTMSETAKIVKKQHDNLDINKVEDIVDEMREQREISEEIGNILAQTTTKTDDEDLLNELNNMQQEELDEKMLQTGEQPSKLPDVPTQLPAQAAAASTSNKKAEEELDELKKWASAAQ